MIVFTTKPQGPVAGHDDVYRTGVEGRRRVLELERGGIGWVGEVKINGEWKPYNAPHGWWVGFMRPWLPIETSVLVYDGVALWSFTAGFFRINVSRRATEDDFRRAD